jgi:hypothetical protein
MEAVGAVASIIAIGQAAAAIPGIVSFFRSLPEVRNEAASLVNEVFLTPYLRTFQSLTLTVSQLETLRATHGQIKSLMPLMTSSNPSQLELGIISTVDTSLLERAATELKELLSALETFRDACQSRKRQHKVSRFKWMWQKHRVPDLYQRSVSIRSNLQVAMSAISLHFHQ